MLADMARPDTSGAAQIAAVAVLGDAVRRGLFEFVRSTRRPVTREESAAAVGISRKLAAFHLEKLVDAGLLLVDVAGRRGHGVGRRPKTYVAAPGDVMVSIPPRRTDVLAGILLAAILAETPSESAARTALRVAHARGLAAGESMRRQLPRGRLGAQRVFGLVADLLGRHGYEPDVVPQSGIRLRNCPFHPLAAQAPELVCGINHAFVAGILTGLEASSLEAALVPQEGECCVEVRVDPARRR
jgi:predicted ArsR family transcriptional regulator